MVAFDFEGSGLGVRMVAGARTVFSAGELYKMTSHLPTNRRIAAAKATATKTDPKPFSRLTLSRNGSPGASPFNEVHIDQALIFSLHFATVLAVKLVFEQVVSRL